MTDSCEDEPVGRRGGAAAASPRSVERADAVALLVILRRIMAAGPHEAPGTASGEVLER
jgi:hypothetical protein